VPFLIVENDCRATNLFSRPPFSQTHAIKILRQPFFFNVIESSGNYVLEDDKPSPSPTALRERVISYALGAYKVLIESDVAETSERAHSIGN
jgi:hypothetical protein